jgi:hypothetical protein
MPIDASKVVWDDAPDPALVKWDDKPRLSDIPKAAWKQTKDLVLGGLRGAGSIGATLLSPMDYLNQYLMEQRGLKPGNLSGQRREAPGLAGFLERLPLKPGLLLLLRMRWLPMECARVVWVGCNPSRLGLWGVRFLVAYRRV